jgi:hypothetical protein
MPCSLKFRAAFMAGLLPIFGTPAAEANVVYSYLGNPFNTFQASPNANAQEFVGQSVSGEFTLGRSLGDNFNGTVTPTQFSFSNGVLSLSSSQSPTYAFDIQTSSTGAIVDWMISISINFGAGGVFMGTTNSSDSTSIIGPTTFISANNSGVPGTWSVQVTPIPAALPLFATGFFALALFLWRGKRA